MPKVLERYKRREPKIDEQIIEMFIRGISTRKMKAVTKSLFGKGYSAATISRINRQLTEEMKAWMAAPIEDDIMYIYLDGLNLPVRRFVVSKESLLMAIGITTGGQRKILGVQLGARESADSWREFLKELIGRGLRGKNLKLGIMDGLPGLEKAFSECFPRARIQRCIVHKLRNIAAKLPRKIQRDCLAHVAGSLEEARERFKAWEETWGMIAPTAVECLKKDLETVLEFYRYPKGHWKSIRSTNIIERTFKEFRRRTWTVSRTKNAVFAASTRLPRG